jgi:ssDNA-binding Zn-finger/Zn-ribbon topoisomerase 1
MDKPPVPPRFPCPEEGCDGELIRRWSTKFSRHFFGCTNWPNCKGGMGCHPDGTPLGIPADAATRKVRIKAHEVFDRLWKKPGGVMSRTKAYRWLAAQMKAQEVHIGQMDADECRRVIKIVRHHFPELVGSDERSGPDLDH